MRTATVVCLLAALATLGSIHFADLNRPTSHGGSPAFQALLQDAVHRLEGTTMGVTSVTVGVAHAQSGNERVPPVTIDDCATYDGGITCDGTATCQETCTGWPNCDIPTVYPLITCDRGQTECWDLTYAALSATCEAGTATCDATATCSRFYTCDSQFTCHGEVSCDGALTCWNSTCDDVQMTCDGTSATCDAACVRYTMQGNFTCDGTTTCQETCEDWPDCGTPTLYPSPTCNNDTPDCWEWTYTPGEPTCDATIPTCGSEATCLRFYTCDSQFTCHGEVTCNGEATCWASTCQGSALTCDGTPECCRDPYTFQGNFTCDGNMTCENTCDGWPTCDGSATCEGVDTCTQTCTGWPGCYEGQASGSERTTWGKMKRNFDNE